MTESGSEEKWEQFCIVGLGNHARSKLLPAIVANGQSVYGLVTRQAPSVWPGFNVYRDIASALPGMTQRDVVLICTPPEQHISACLAALEAGIDVLVEKPAFATEADAIAALAAANKSGALVVEAFMYRHTILFSRFLTLWTELRERVQCVEATFHIPALPNGTFRHGSSIAASTLFDVGCYPLALFQDMGLNLSGLEIDDVRAPNEPEREAVRLSARIGGLLVVADVGVSSAYVNRVTLTLDTNETIIFEPFFFGRQGARRIARSVSGGMQEETLEERDAFRTMLAIPPARYGADISLQRQMVGSARHLERLGLELARWRRG